jgi:soluble lytic murein transglycosylase
MRTLILILALLASPASASWDIHAQALRAAHQHAVPVELVLAVIEVESHYKTQAVSSVGARGLMQLRPCTAEWFAKKVGLPYHGPESLHDPTVNIPLGTAYLAYLLSKFDTVHHALAAYNMGPGTVNRKLSRGAQVPAGYSEKVFRTLTSMGSRLRYKSN